jgi:hypothetical protein
LWGHTKKAVSTRQVLLASVSAVALFIASEAKSADLPVKAPIIAPAPIFSWTGCYVGGHVGFGWAAIITPKLVVSPALVLPSSMPRPPAGWIPAAA